ncbi:MAG: hypothetical protein PHT02_07060 [Tissierellia bacterium]|nr:hypothetical protein [Tissierellia bacterium]
MEIGEKIGYINEELNQGRSLKAIAGELGIGYSTIKEKLSKAGFKRVDGIYVIQSNSEEVEDESIEVKQLLEQNYFAKTFNNPELNELLKNVFSRLDIIEERLLQRNATNDSIVIDLPDDSEKQMSGRVNATIYSEFQEFCKDHKYLAKDLLSMALKEYMRNHRE